MKYEIKMKCTMRNECKWDATHKMKGRKVNENVSIQYPLAGKQDLIEEVK